MDKTGLDEIKWFVMRAYKCESKAEERLSGEGGLEFFIPKTYAVRVYHGVKSRRLVPAIPSLVFVHASKRQMVEFKKDNNFLQFIMHRTSERSEYLSVPDRQMDNFIIEKIEKYIFDSIKISFDGDDAKKVLGYYKTFYQKLALRNKDNSRIRVFTTNNDLFNEVALDALNIHYINGFSGGLHRYFNPAIFNYTWSKRMDTSIDKYEPVENMVYLYKIHGSVNWRESESAGNNFFEIEEVVPSEASADGSVLIYPTPTKQDKSLGSPYVDLFREFQNKLLEPHSVLFVIGYSFSDRHINDIIYRALATNSTINVVIFGERPEESERKNKPVFFIDDSRIFTISGKIYADESGKKELQTINHFDYIVNTLIPNLDDSRKEDDLLNKFVKSLKEASTK